MHELEQTRVNVLVSAQHGDFAEFARIYVPFVYRVARGLALDESTASDVAQEALLDLVKQMRDFHYDPTKQFRRFVRRVVYRRMIDYFRKRREESLECIAHVRGLAPAEVEELSDRNASQEISDAMLDRELERTCIEAALEEVKSEVQPATYQAFHLVVLQGETVESAARILDQSPNQVSQNKHRITRKLRAKLERLSRRFGDGAD